MFNDTERTARLCRLPDVAVMEATDLGDLHDIARLGGLHGPAVRRALVEREMGAGPMVVGEIAGQDAAQMAFAQNEDMIETLMPDRADEALGEGILPRAARRRQGFLDTHALDALPERLPVDTVAIAEQALRRGLVGEGVDDLLGGPGSGG
jgi:hypothetical protein